MINFLRVARQIIDYKSLLVLNGDIPGKEFFGQSKVPIIAADGAAKQLSKINIIPDLIVGDLDSCPVDLFPSVERIPLLDQNYSDFEKALYYLQEKQLTPALITGLTGGYLDHILYNFILFKKSNSIALGQDQIVFLLQEGTKVLSLPKGTKISFFGYPEATITTKGLKWELKNDLLSFFERNSPFNRVNQEKLEITVTGKVLVIVYLLSIQDLGS
jgi:thiamine pyrophosphokinase